MYKKVVSLFLYLSKKIMQASYVLTFSYFKSTSLHKYCMSVNKELMKTTQRLQIDHTNCLTWKMPSSIGKCLQHNYVGKKRTSLCQSKKTTDCRQLGINGQGQFFFNDGRRQFWLNLKKSWFQAKIPLLKAICLGDWESKTCKREKYQYSLKRN